MLVHDTVGTGRSQVEIDQIRLSLQARHDELSAEYEQAVAQSQVLRLVEVGDTAGDDQADSGTKTAERDTAQSLLRTILERRAQSQDHPILLTVPETLYLKCLVLEVIGG